MKRTTLVLDEEVLEEATRLSGEKTYSATVMRALEVFRSRRPLDLEALVDFDDVATWRFSTGIGTSARSHGSRHSASYPHDAPRSARTPTPRFEKSDRIWVQHRGKSTSATRM